MNKKNIIITGAAGFIANSLIQYFLKKKYFVIGIDNFLCGTSKNIQKFKNDKNFIFYEIDLSNYNDLKKINKYKGKVKEIWHLAANSDIPKGISDPSVDFDNTFMTTFNVLKLAKTMNIYEFYFASSSAVYGDYKNKVTRETDPLNPISNYGAMKACSEMIISSAYNDFLNKAFIFRFPNVIGSPATHGVIYDLVKKLLANPNKLDVLGNGTQRKSYLHVSELIKAMMKLRNQSKIKYDTFNIGPNENDGVTVKFIAESIVKIISPSAKIFYQDSNFGWKGDIPKFRLSVKKIFNSEWRPKLSPKDVIIKTIKEVYNQLR